MEKFVTTDGVEFFFTNKYMQYGEKQYRYINMDSVMHRRGDNPAFIVECNGEKVRIFYQRTQKADILKYFRRISDFITNRIEQEESIRAAEQANISYMNRLEELKQNRAPDRKIPGAVTMTNAEKKVQAEFNERENYYRRWVGGDKASKYVDDFEVPISWNWCAFFVTPLWLMYRKLFVPTLAYIMLYVVAFRISENLNVLNLKPLKDELNGITFEKLKNTDFLIEECKQIFYLIRETFSIDVLYMFVPFLILAFIFGLTGNAIYRLRIDIAYKSKHKDALCRRRGRTSSFYAFIAIVMMVAVNIFLR